MESGPDDSDPAPAVLFIFSDDPGLGQIRLAVDCRGIIFAGMSEPVIAQRSPYAVNVEAGRTYAWCACGRSQSQPFCDGAHRGTGLAPRLFKPEQNGPVQFCGCKHSQTGATCDGSHAKLPPAPALTPEEQMQRFEKELKESDWGHQPC